MIQLFNADRPISRVAARAVHPARPIQNRGLPWRTGRAPASLPFPSGEGSVDEGPHRALLEHLITTALFGDADKLPTVLTDDARVWSPSVCFSSAAEARSLLGDNPSTLAVSQFRFDRLSWAAPCAVAEWRLTAQHVEPLLIGDDVLIEGSDAPVTLVGASIAELRGDRIAGLHTYFDDASLIEQVVMGL